MSRFVDDLRARARFVGGTAAGYSAGGHSALAQTAERIVTDLLSAADGLEELARLEAGTADREARDEATIARFFATNPGWAQYLMTGGHS